MRRCKAAERAYQAAGMNPKDIDFVELHDCFSMAEIIDSEDLGLVPRGMGAKWAAEGRTLVGGDIPINPPAGCWRRATRSAPPAWGSSTRPSCSCAACHANQVKDAGIGMTHNLGGAGIACTVSILKRSDA